jgi:beta-xylosidase
LKSLNGIYKVRIWQIDETHTNPYNLAKSNGWGDVFNEEQIKILQNEGTLAPIQEYSISFNGDSEISLSFSNNALLLVELEKND